MQRLHKLVWPGRKGRKRVAGLTIVIPGAPQTGDGHRFLSLEKYLDRRQFFAFYGPFIEAVYGQDAPLALLEQLRPQLFVVHGVDTGVKGGGFCLPWIRAVPTTPPTA